MPHNDGKKTASKAPKWANVKDPGVLSFRNVTNSFGNTLDCVYRLGIESAVDPNLQDCCESKQSSLTKDFGGLRERNRKHNLFVFNSEGGLQGLRYHASEVLKGEPGDA